MDYQPLWKSSNFNMWAHHSDGTLFVVNIFSGALVRIRAEEVDYVSAILAGEPVKNPKGISAVLAQNGMLVPSFVDESQEARHLYEYLFKKNDRLHLTLLPTTQCNFRCKYCYEDFQSSRMLREITNSVVNLVQRQAAALHTLSISWFGGEPLLALDIIEDLSYRITTICEENEVRYSANMTTNGYLLTQPVIERCFSVGISKFQITLDGPSDIHDALRVLANGKGTFDTIFANLLNLRDSKNDFHVRIRVNFTPATIPFLPEFIRFLGNEFAADSRFSIYFRGVGDWGGEHDNSLKLCNQRTADNHEIQFMSLALKAGFGLDSWKEALQPFGSVCYAADPQQFVIGTDGSVYKCTVAFSDPRNQIGMLRPDGILDIDEQLHHAWTSSGEEIDTECQMCAFRPACQGNACPYARLNVGEKQCPRAMNHLDKFLPLLATEATILNQ